MTPITSVKDTIFSPQPGFQVSGLPFAWAPFVHLAFTLRCGTSREREGQYGFLSLLGTLFSRGSGSLDRSAFAEDCDSRGANINVYPGRDYLTLEFWVLPHDLSWALETLNRMLWQTRLDPEEIQIAIEEHLQQLAARGDEKRSRIFDSARSNLFSPKHHYSRPLLGTLESLSSADRPRVQQFHSDLLESVSGVLCVTGGFDQGHLEELVCAHFGRARFAPADDSAARPEVFIGGRNRVVEIAFPVEQSELLIALPAYARTHPDYRLAQFCNEILGGAFLSRLTRAVRMGEGMAYSADSRFLAGSEAGVYWIGMQTDRGRVEQALDTVRRCIDELRADGVGGDEFHHFKEFVSCSMPFDYDALASLTSRRLENLLYGEPWRLSERLDLFHERTTPEAVHRVFQDLLQPDRALVCILGEKVDGSASQAFHRSHRQHSSATPPLALLEGPKVEPAVARVRATKVQSNPSGELYRFPSGLHLLSLPREDVASVSLQVWTVTGSMDEQKGRTGLSHLLEHLMFRGTERFPDGSFDAILAQRGGLNNAFTTEDFTVYTDYLSPEALEEALGLEADRFCNLEISDEIFQTERSVVLEERSVRVDCNPLGKAYEKLQHLAFAEGPYAHPVIGWREDLESLQLEDVRRHYRLASEPSRLLIVVAGGCSSQRALELVEAAFSDASKEVAGDPVWPVLCETLEVPKLTPQGFELRERSGYSYLLLCYRFPREGHPDYEACELLSRILGDGDSSCLYQRFVREERSFLEVWTTYESQAREHPLLHFGFATPENFEAAEQARKVGDYLSDLGHLLDQSKLDKARVSWIAEEAFGTDELEDWALEIAGRVLLSSWSEAWSHTERIEAVGLDDLRRVAERYLSPDGLVYVSLQGESEAE